MTVEERDRLALARALRPESRGALVPGVVERGAWIDDPPRFVFAVTLGAEGTPGAEDLIGHPVDIRVYDPATAHTRTADDHERSLLAAAATPAALRVRSPDGRLVLDRDGDLLRLRDERRQKSLRIAAEATPDTELGVAFPGGARLAALWSPDSRAVLAQRVRTEGVREVHVSDSVSDADGVARDLRVRVAHPGDATVPTAELLIVDAATGTVIVPRIPAFPCTHSSPLVRGDVWWSADGAHFYALHSTRDWRALRLVEVDARTGESVMLVEERSERRVRPSDAFHLPPLVRVIPDAHGRAAEVVWFSERTGWGRLYLRDLASGAERVLTPDGVVAVGILRIDPAERAIWVQLAGCDSADPARRTVHRIELDTGARRTLDDDGRDHHPLGIARHEGAAPLFVEIASTVAMPAVARVRDWDGAIVAELDRAETTDLERIGWRAPERFEVLAADGVTRVFGTMYYPPGFDASRSWPLLDHMYAGAHVARTGASFTADEAESFAALGFVVVAIDGRGTPGRGREFQDHSWSNLARGSVEDHAAAIEQLLARHSFLDPARVGAYGHSTGGYNVVVAMAEFPELFRVGVAAAGRYDGRRVMAMILEAYDHPEDADSWARADAIARAARVTGELLVVHGESDTGVPIHHAWRLLDELFRADRDVDMLFVPGGDHEFTRHRDYVDRRVWRWLRQKLGASERGEPRSSASSSANM